MSIDRMTYDELAELEFQLSEELRLRKLDSMAGKVSTSENGVIKIYSDIELKDYVLPTFLGEAELLARLLEEWAKGTKAAMKEALAILTGDLALSDKAARQVLTAFETRLGSEFGAAVAPDVKQLMDLSYRDGKKYIIGPKDLPLNIAVMDEAAIAWLGKHHMFWVGNYYDRKMSDLIAGIIEDGMSQGLGRADVGSGLKLFFDKYPGLAQKPDNYWRLVASEGMSDSRHFGIINGFEEVGIINYRILGVGDERQCSICRDMDGRTFSVQSAVNRRDKMMAAKSPEDVKAVKIWPKLENIKGKPSAELEAAGVNMPSFHGKCRCTVVEA